MWPSLVQSKIRNKKLIIHLLLALSLLENLVTSISSSLCHFTWWMIEFWHALEIQETYPKFLNIHWKYEALFKCTVHDVVIRINLTYSHCRRWSRLEIMIVVVTKWILSSGLAVDCGHLIAAALHSGIGNNSYIYVKIICIWYTIIQSLIISALNHT